MNFNLPIIHKSEHQIFLSMTDRTSCQLINQFMSIIYQLTKIPKDLSSDLNTSRRKYN